jgi:hypothetical protein
MKLALFTTIAVLATWPFLPAAGGASLAFVGTALALGIGGAALGAVAGAIPKKQESSGGINLKDASGLENSAASGLGNDYNSLRAMLEGGAQSGDYSAGMQSQRDYAAMLGQYAQSGGLPGQDDLTNANIFAQRAYDPQRVALQQSFQDQTTEANRQAAMMGRGSDDPILQAKLRTGLMRQSASLQAEQGAFANNFAMQLPQQRLNYAGQQASALDQIGQRASANRQLLMSLGSGILGNERSFRVQTSDQWGKQQSGGGVGGAISGALGGFGGGMQAFTAGQGAGLFGGGGGGAGLSGAGGGSPFAAAQAPSAYGAAAFAPRAAFEKSAPFGWQGGGSRSFGQVGGF